MSAARMTNHRDLEELTRIHVNRVYQNMQLHQLTGAIQSFHMKQTPHKRKIGDKLHIQKNKVCKPKTQRKVQTRHVTSASISADSKLTRSVNLIKLWLQNTASTNQADMQTYKTANNDVQSCSMKEHMSRLHIRAPSWHTSVAAQRTI